MKHSKRTSVLALLLAALLLFSVAAPAAAADIPTPTGFKAELSSLDNNYIACSWDRTNASWQSFSGYVIQYSTDKTTWMIAKADYNREAYYTSFNTFEEGSNPVKGTTYYFRMMYISYDRKSYGEPSNIVSLKYGEAEAPIPAGLQKEFDQLKKDVAAKPKTTTKKISGGMLQKGAQIIFTHPLYKVTVQITKVEKSENKVSYKATIESKYKIKFATTYDYNRSQSKDQKTETGFFFVYSFDPDTIEFSLSYADFATWVSNRFENKVDGYNEINDLMFYKAVEDLRYEFKGCKGLGMEAKLSKSYLDSDYKSITISKDAAYLFDFYYRESGTKKWKKVAYKNDDSRKLTAKKLKANTMYQVRIRPFALAYAGTKQEKKTYEPYSNTIKIRTGAKEKPVVTSAKVTNVKKTYEHHDGYWIRNTFEPDRWVPPRDEKITTYTVTVKIKSLPENAVGVYAGGKAQKGTTVTFTSAVAGHVNKINRNIGVYTYMENRGTNQYGYSDVTGTSPAAMVNIHN